MKTERLQVVLARAGIAARRKAVVLIESGVVSVNGWPVCEPGFRVDREKDSIRVNGKAISAEKKYYFLLNKPKGVISTASDELKRKTVLDFAHSKERLYPVGRLDKDTTGLLILTNDGNLAYRLTHPKFGVERVYEAEVKGVPSASALEKIKSGINIEGYINRAENITIKRTTQTNCTLIVKMLEGKKREIRNLFLAVGHPVTALKRISYGPVNLGQLKEGCTRELTAKEMSDLKKL